MASVLSIYQGTALLLKQKPPATLSDNTIIRTTMDVAYPSVLSWMLEAGEWRFAARAVGLQADTTDAPSFGYNYFFTKPQDYVRLIKISSGPYLYPTLDDFSEEAQQFAANCNPLFLLYVSNDSNHGLNLGVWGAHFEVAFHHELAVRVAPHITKMTRAEFDLLKKDSKHAMAEARSKDAINLPAERPPPGLLTQARFGRRGYYGPGWGGPLW